MVDNGKTVFFFRNCICNNNNFEAMKISNKIIS